jgi:hypothetical protein
LPPDSTGIRRAGKRLRRRGWGAGVFHHVAQHLAKVIEAGRRDDDAVAAATHLLGDAQEAAARIFLERELEQLALDLHPLGADYGFVDGRTALLELPVAIGARFSKHDRVLRCAPMGALVQVSQSIVRYDCQLRNLDPKRDWEFNPVTCQR